MKKLTILIVGKTSEPGLMAIVDGRIKSLVPVFNGTRIIDYYTAPLIAAGFKSILLLVEKDTPGIKNHLGYSYGQTKIKILEEVDIRGRLGKLLSLSRNEALILLRADEVILTDWGKLIQHLLTLPQTNYAVMTKKRELIGFFIQKPVSIDRSGKEGVEITNESSKLEGVRNGWSEYLISSLKVVFWNAICYTMKTVVEYYDVHFSILKDLKEYMRVCSALPSNEHNGDYLSSISHTGFIRHSSVSHSCTVEGYVERSLLFSNVRVGRNARVINSIVMENNYIGEGSCIQNAIICDNGELFPKLSPNIGERTRIGDNGGSGHNRLYPNYLYRGITLIGRNVEIPKDCSIPGNCFVASNADRASFRGRGRMRDGDSLLD